MKRNVEILEVLLAFFAVLLLPEHDSIAGGRVETVHGRIVGLLPEDRQLMEKPQIEVISDGSPSLVRNINDFIVNRDANIRVNGRKRAFSALREGMDVTILYVQAWDEFLALSVVANSSSPTPSATPAITATPTPINTPSQ